MRRFPISRFLIIGVVAALAVAACGGSAGEVDAGSPAGAFVGYDADGRITVFDEELAEVRALGTFGSIAEPFTRTVVSPLAASDTHVFVVDGDQIVRIPIAGGEPEPITSGNGVAVSADGRFLAVERWCDGVPELENEPPEPGDYDGPGCTRVLYVRDLSRGGERIATTGSGEGPLLRGISDDGAYVMAEAFDFVDDQGEGPIAVVTVAGGKPSTRTVAVRAATFAGDAVFGFAYPEDYVGVDVVRVGPVSEIEARGPGSRVDVYDDDDGGRGEATTFVSHPAFAGEALTIDRVASIASGRTTLAISEEGANPIRYVLDDVRSPTPTLRRVPNDILWLVPIPPSTAD